MLNFAKKIFRSSVSSVEAPDTFCLEGDFFILDGGNWQSLSDERCKVSFRTNEKGVAILEISCKAESVNEAFSLDSLTNLTRFLDEEENSCFQWIVKKGKGGESMEEFGLRFEREEQADRFAAEFASMGQQMASVVVEFHSSKETSVIELVEKVSDSEWEQVEENVSVVVSKTKKDEHYLTIQKGTSILFHALISRSLQIQFEYPIMAFVGFTPLHEEVRVLGVHLDARESYEALEQVIQSTVLVGRPPREVRPAPPKVAAEDVEMWSDQEEFKETPVKSRRAATRRRRRYSSSSSSSSGEEDEKGIINKHLQLGHLEKSRAIVFSSQRGGSSTSGFRVFNTQDKVRGKKNSNVMASVSGFTKIGAVKPSSVMVHEGDAKVLMLDPGLGRDKIFELDLERGQVVNEWTPGLGTSVNSILPVSKSAQSNAAEKTFLAMNEKGIFMMDPRQRTNEIFGNRVRTFNYSTNVKLSAAATDSNSRIVVGNKAGQFRLFDGKSSTDDSQQFKRAKTLLAGLGDPISHVELTSDGEWILGTCATYLVLIRTTSEDGSSSGFSKSIGNSADVITLALSHQDVVSYKLKQIEFSPAKFDESRNVIITSTGSLAILWDFAKIKNSGKLGYSVKPMRDFILDTQAMGGNNVVAMYENKLEIARINKTN